MTLSITKYTARNGTIGAGVPFTVADEDQV